MCQTHLQDTVSANLAWRLLHTTLVALLTWLQCTPVLREVAGHRIRNNAEQAV